MTGDSWFEAKDTYRGGPELENLSRREWPPKPTHRQHAKKMAMGNETDRAIIRFDSCDRLGRPFHDLIRGFSAGASVPEEIPAGIHGADFSRGFSLVLTVIPLDQGVVHLGSSREPRDFTRLSRANERTGEQKFELDFAQGSAEFPSLDNSRF